MIPAYADLYQTAMINPSHSAEIVARVEKILSYRESHYDPLAIVSGVPWGCLAAVHSLETGLRFDRHLHNGDPLTARTVRVPKNRPTALPASGAFPYTWLESAIDALSDRWKPARWDLGSCLEFIERFNGLGPYEHRGINSPYLFSFTNLYQKGLYVSDGSFDSEKVSENIGAVGILKTLEARGAQPFVLP